MVLDGLRGYLQLASGLTEVTRERALAAAKAVAAQGEASVGAVAPGVREQVTSLTDDLLAASRANRNLLIHLVRVEVERSVSRLGLVSSHEVDAANRRAKALERRVEELEQELSATRSGGSRTAKKSTKKAAAKKSTAKKSTAKKSTAKKAATKQADSATPPAGDATATSRSTASGTTAAGGSPTGESPTSGATASPTTAANESPTSGTTSTNETTA